MENLNDTYNKVWNELVSLGYEKGDAISYFDFSECCSPFCDVDDIDRDLFEETFDVSIG